MNRPFAISARELDGHVEWVRALARRLVRDEHRADDLAQQTWLAALCHPPERGRPIRPWLAAVLRNFRRQDARVEARRRARERARVDAEPFPAAGDAVSEVETHRLLVDAVLELGEPGRSTILLHFFKGLSLADIARQSGTPEGTVRSRLQRGLAALRVRLGAGRGDRALQSVLLPLLGPSAVNSGASLTAGAVMLGAVSKKLLLIAAALLLIPAVWMLLDTAPPDPPGHADPASQVSAPTIPNPAAPAARAAETSGPVAVDAPVSTERSEIQREVEDDRTLVRGRCVGVDGTPLEGMTVDLKGFANPPKPGQKPAPRFQSLQQTTPADGRFAFRLDPPETHRFSVLFEGPAPRVRTSWILGELEPGKTHDLGDRMIETGGTVLARVVDRHGRTVAKNVAVRIQRPGRPLDDDRQTFDVTGRPEAGSGVCRVESVPPGPCETQVCFDNGAQSSGPTIEVRPGATLEVVIPYHGPDPTRRIQLTVLVTPNVTIYPERASVRLSGSGITPREPEEQPYPQQKYVFDDVPPGEYTLDIQDPKFETWSKHGVRPGDVRTTFAKLRGTSALKVSVRDRRTGAPLSRYGLSLLAQHWQVYPKELVLQEEEEVPPTDGLFDGLVAYDCVVRIMAQGLAVFEQPLREFRAGETREIRADLVPGGTFAGLVLMADRSTPAAGASVGLYRVAEVNDGPDSPYLEPGRHSSRPQECRMGLAAMQTDELGHFRFDGIPAGEFVLRAALGADTFSVLDGLRITLDEVRDDLRLVLPEAHYLSGKLLLPSELVLERMILLAFPESGALNPGTGSIAVVYGVRTNKYEELRSEISPDGGFRVGPLPSGPARVALMPLSLRRLNVAGAADETMDAAGLDLGVVVIQKTPETSKDFDLRARAPGSLEVRVRVGDGPGRNLEVHAHPLGRGRSLGLSSTSENGRATLQLFPGLWSLAVWSRDNRWSYHHPTPLQIQPGDAQSLEIPIQLVRASLLLLDDRTHEPMADQQFFVRPVSQSGYGTILSTDGLGRLTLDRPVGEFEISRVMSNAERANRRGSSRPSDHRVSWTARGPLPAALAIRAAD